MAECNHWWTTGTGPDDPRDTGHHRCILLAGHEGTFHGCFCGMTKLMVSTGDEYVDDEWYPDD
jgi:hypothetical protein